MQDVRHDGDVGAVRLARLVQLTLADSPGSVVSVSVHGPGCDRVMGSSPKCHLRDLDYFVTNEL